VGSKENARRRTGENDNCERRLKKRMMSIMLNLWRVRGRGNHLEAV
jgi:hypothetical protein